MRSIFTYLFALLCSLYSFTIGFIVSGRARRTVWMLAKHFGLSDDKPGIPPINISEFLSDDLVINISRIASRDGNVTNTELSLIAGIVKSHQPRTIFEIGTYDGRTTLNMALNASQECRVYTLDLPKSGMDTTKLHLSTSDRAFVNKEKSGSRMEGTDLASRIVQLYGDSATFDYTPYLNSIDLVFVDGSHTFDYVVSDTNIALRLLRNGKGIIIWHDYRAWPGVTKALEEFHLKGGAFAEMKQIAGTTVVTLRLLS